MSGVEIGASSIQGSGIFARRAFRAGERIRRINVVREITPENPLRPEAGERVDHCNYVHGRVFLIGPPDRHLNHSCEPNAWLEYDGDQPYLVAMRAIAEGEELTCDYRINVTGGDSWPCACGAGRCTGTVTGDYFALPPALQREYRPFLAAWFVRLHRERLEPPPE